MDAESGCLLFTKALCLEAIRFTVAGWPLGCLREAFRDGESYFAGDLVLLNEPAVFHDPDIWFKKLPQVLSGDEKHLFIPTRGQKADTADLTQRMLLNSKLCFLTREFIFHLLLASTVHLFSRCSIKDARGEEAVEFSDPPLFLPLDFSAMCDVVMRQRNQRTL